MREIAPAERFARGGVLFDDFSHRMRDEYRSRHPDADDARIERSFGGAQVIRTDRWPAIHRFVVLAALGFCLNASTLAETRPMFRVTAAPALAGAPHVGRLIVILGRSASPEPREALGQTGMHQPHMLAADARLTGPGQFVTVDASADCFPLNSAAAIPAGEYFAQAVLLCNRDLYLPDAPGNLFSKPTKVRVDFAAPSGAPIDIELSEQAPEESPPAETEYVKFIRLESPLLSQFHKRPMFLRAGVILPRDAGRDPAERLPLRVHIGGFGARFTDAARMMQPGSSFRRAWLADDAPRMILLHLDGAGPFGDPYQVNSENNGPYGDALTQELIPHVEQKFGAIGTPQSRVLDGGSTGGWVSLALQVYYPDFFNGCWSGFPDGVDFRAFQLINVYEDANAYVNASGFERPSMRSSTGDILFTVRHECQMENLLGAGGSWTRSGGQWGAWNATYGPRGPDGQPAAIWDPRTGALDPSMREAWKKHDLRLILERDWATLGPKLRGKLHIWVGEADEYFLNNAVHLLDRFLSRADPPFDGWIKFGERRGHGWMPLSESELLRQMAARVLPADK